MTKRQSSTAIWREFENKTADWSAWLVLRNGDPVAKIVTHYGGRRSPSGLTVRAYVHVLGLPMVRGIARGGGYDMRTAAIASAAARVTYHPPQTEHAATVANVADDFKVLKDHGYDIPHQLREMGYQVEQVM